MEVNNPRLRGLLKLVAMVIMTLLHLTPPRSPRCSLWSPSRFLSHPRGERAGRARRGAGGLPEWQRQQPGQEGVPAVAPPPHPPTPPTSSFCLSHACIAHTHNTHTCPHTRPVHPVSWAPPRGDADIPAGRDGSEAGGTGSGCIPVRPVWTGGDHRSSLLGQGGGLGGS